MQIRKKKRQKSENRRDVRSMGMYFFLFEKKKLKEKENEFKWGLIL
jgi:hypothetical protein